MKRMKYTTTGELAQKLVDHLVRNRVPREVAQMRAAVYYGLGDTRGSRHP